MTEQMRKKFVRSLDTVDLADLRSANTCGMDLHEHLPAFERRQLDLVDDQRLALLDQNGGGCFQGILTTDDTDYTNRVRQENREELRNVLTTDNTDFTNRFRTQHF